MVKISSNCKSSIFVCLFIVILSFQNLSFAQKPNLNFDYLGVKHGLPSIQILSAAQDSLGFIWFGTKEGLCRYDGYEIKIYKKEIFNKNSLSGNTITSIAVDKNGNLWIGTSSNNLNFYDYRKDEFKRIDYRPSELKHNVPLKSINSIFKDSQNNIWIATSNGIIKFSNADFEKKEFYLLNNKMSILDIKEDYYGNIWAVIEKKLIKYDPFTNKFYQEIFKSDKSYQLFHNSILFRKEKIWISTDSGIVSYKLNDKGIIDHDSREYFYVGSNIKLEDMVYYKNKLWIASHYEGLWVYDLEKKEIFNYRFDPKYSQKIANNYLSTIFKDRDNSLWILTSANGISIYYDTEFKQIPFNGYIRDFTKTIGSRFYFTSKKSIYKFDLLKQKITKTFDIQGNRFIIKILAVQGGILVSTSDGSLYFYNISKSSIEKIENYYENKLIISAMLYHNEKIYFGTRGKGIFTFDFSSRKCKRIIDIDDSVSDILIDENSIWIGTIRNGIYIASLYNDELLHYKFDSNNELGISSNFIRDLYKDSNDNIWIGTLQGGLNKYNRAKKSFTHVFDNDGLLENDVYGILENSPGTILIIQDDGIVKYKIKENSFIQYQRNRGIINNIFRVNASVRWKDKVFIGGKMGITIYDQIVNENLNTKRKIQLTDVKIYNESINYFSLIDKNNRIVLDYDQNYISFEFSALAFKNPDNVTYKYKMDGIEEDWIEVRHNRTVQYTNLSPGEYVFHIKSTNEYGESNENEFIKHIKVNEAFWEKAYFRFMIVLVLIISVIIIYRFRLYFIRKSNRLLRKQVTEKKILTNEINNLSDKLGREVSQKKNYEESLNNNIKKYEKLINTQSDGIITFDKNGKIIFTNKAALKLFGGNVINRSLFDFVINKNQKEIISKFQQITQNSRLQFDMISKKGEEKSVIVVINENQHDGNYYGTIRELELQNKKSDRLSEELDQLKKIIDNLDVGIILLEGEKIIYSNDKLKEITGYEKKELDSKPIDVFFSKPNQPRSFSIGKNSEILIPFESKGGFEKQIKLSSQKHLVLDKEISVIVLSDVTKEYKIINSNNTFLDLFMESLKDKDDLFFLTDSKMDVIYSNKSWLLNTNNNGSLLSESKLSKSIKNEFQKKSLAEKIEKLNLLNLEFENLEIEINTKNERKNYKFSGYPLLLQSKKSMFFLVYGNKQN